MRKLLFTRIFILPALLALFIGVFTLIAFKQSSVECTKGTECVQNAPFERTGDMLWDQVARHFVTLVSI